MTGPVHVPVMRDRVVALLAPALTEPGAVFVDATVGLGGHSAAVLESIPTCRLIGLDRDVVVVGNGTTCEIWDAEAWQQYLAGQEDAFSSISEEVVPGIL